jgi:signal transduction histidine kinase
MIRPTFRSFWARIFWAVVPVVALFLVVQAIINIREYRRLVTEEFVKRGQAVASYLGSSTELGVLTEDRQMLNGAIRGVLRDADIAYVVIHGEDGRVLADGGRSAATAVPVTQPLTDKATSRAVDHGSERVIEFLVPVISADATTPVQLVAGAGGTEREAARLVGRVRLGLSLQSVEQHIAHLARLWGGITVGFLILSVLAIYAFSRRVTRPIKLLTQQARQIADGFLDQRIQVRSGDEIGQLAVAFNEMTVALKANIDDKERVLAELQELNRTLEDRIALRTAELEERGRALQRSLEEVRAMGEISRTVGSSLDLGQVLHTISAHAVRLSGSEAGGIFEIDPASERFVVVAAHNIPNDVQTALHGAAVTPGTAAPGPIRLAINSGEPVQAPDIGQGAAGALDALYRRIGYRSLLAVPMGSGAPRAMVLYRRTPGRFDDRTVEILTTLANQSKVAIDNARLFRELQVKSGQLEVASRHKSDFLASVSHELRTPLNAILGFNEMIIEGLYGDVPTDLEVPLTDIQHSGRHLLRLINDVLDLSKIEAGRMDLALSDYSVTDIVAAVRTSLRPLAVEKGLELVVAVPPLPIAHGDPKRLVQCLTNLVGNAIKFTREGHVSVAVELDDGQLIYRVSDTGIGIAPDRMNQLFTEFQQADVTIAREFGGTGLGLSITKKLVELHGGRIWVDSRLGHGSTFSFSLPLRVQGGVP